MKSWHYQPYVHLQLSKHSYVIPGTVDSIGFQCYHFDQHIFSR